MYLNKKNHLLWLKECILASLDLPNGGESFHRVLLVDARAAWNRDALNLESVFFFCLDNNNNNNHSKSNNNNDNSNNNKTATTTTTATAATTTTNNNNNSNNCW